MEVTPIWEIVLRFGPLEDCGPVVYDDWSPQIPGLNELLVCKNGFYAFNRGLHVFGKCSSPRFHSLKEWNDPNGWIEAYGGLADGLSFFAEDAFGWQFGWNGECVKHFLPETGETTFYAKDLVGWAERISKDPREELALAGVEPWTALHGPLPFGRHLFPQVPYVMGGVSDPERLAAIDAFENLGWKGSIALQIQDVPDGGKVRLIVGDPPELKV